MRYVVAEVLGADVKEGDRIATKVKRDGVTVEKWEVVRTVEKDVRGCRNVHVNTSQCWDRAGFVPLAVKA